MMGGGVGVSGGEGMDADVSGADGQEYSAITDEISVLKCSSNQKRGNNNNNGEQLNEPCDAENASLYSNQMI